MMIDDDDDDKDDDDDFDTWILWVIAVSNEWESFETVTYICKKNVQLHASALSQRENHCRIPEFTSDKCYIAYRFVNLPSCISRLVEICRLREKNVFLLTADGAEKSAAVRYCAYFLFQRKKTSFWRTLSCAFVITASEMSYCQ